jgi:hypothetical protein
VKLPPHSHRSLLWFISKNGVHPHRLGMEQAPRWDESGSKSIKLKGFLTEFIW